MTGIIGFRFRRLRQVGAVMLVVLGSKSQQGKARTAFPQVLKSEIVRGPIAEFFSIGLEALVRTPAARQ
jgi:hypothetical protein